VSQKTSEPKVRVSQTKVYGEPKKLRKPKRRVSAYAKLYDDPRGRRSTS